MGEILQFKPRESAPVESKEAPVHADAEAWSASELPTLEPAVREHLSGLLAAAERYPEDEFFRNEDGDFPEFSPRDFAELKPLYKALGAPDLVSLQFEDWNVANLAIKVLVVHALKALLKPTAAQSWRFLDSALIAHLEAVARGNAGPAEWAAVVAQYQRKYAHVGRRL